MEGPPSCNHLCLFSGLFHEWVKIRRLVRLICIPADGTLFSMAQCQAIDRRLGQINAAATGEY